MATETSGLGLPLDTYTQLGFWVLYLGFLTLGLIAALLFRFLVNLRGKQWDLTDHL